MCYTPFRMSQMSDTSIFFSKKSDQQDEDEEDG
uniref:ORF49 n=1 Tax=Nitrosopumilaceae spindle-shaped virus TaxID=3065433 RepID=A0AAT9J784_9VIRU